jgi:uncharacterized membrane protein
MLIAVKLASMSGSGGTPTGRKGAIPMAAIFNPPPGWPVPAGWAPPPNWQPDPSWPPAPAGWSFWVDGTVVRRTPAIPGCDWAIGGGAAVFFGSILPFVSNTTNSDYAAFTVSGGGRTASAIFGLVLVALGVAIRRRQVPAAPRPRAPIGLEVTVLVLSGLGALGYLGFAAAGLAGFQEQSDLGYSVTVTFSPSIGLILAILGCVAATAGSIRMLVLANSARRPLPQVR